MTRQAKQLGFNADTKIATLIRQGRSDSDISSILAADGVAVSPRTIARRKRASRSGYGPAGQRPAAPPAPLAKAAPPAAAPTAQALPSDYGYTYDPEAIGAHLEALAEYIDRQVDEAIAAADVEFVRERAESLRGKPTCPSCGRVCP